MKSCPDNARSIVMQDMNREKNTLLRADLGIALGSWYGECNVNSRKDRNSEQVQRLTHLTQNRERDKNEGSLNLIRG